MCFSGWQYFVILSHTDASRGMCPESTGRGQQKLYVWYFSWTLPYDLLSFTNFNLYPFPVINHNHEYNNCQWVLWVFFMNYQTWRWFWGPSELGVAIRCKDYSLYFSVGLKLYALPQRWKENLIDILRKNPVAFDLFPQISQQPPNTFFIYSSSFSSLYHSPMCALFSPKKCLFLMQVIFPISLYFWILHIHYGISLSY